MKPMATMHPDQPFLADVQEIRRRARQHMEKGAVTEGYKADLTDGPALAERSARHRNRVCSALQAPSVHGERARGPVRRRRIRGACGRRAAACRHARAADYAARRRAGFQPRGLLTRSHSEYVEGTTLLDMVKEDLVAERIAIESYSEIIRFLGTNDPTSRRMMEEILAKEEEHADDMANLIDRVSRAGL